MKYKSAGYVNQSVQLCSHTQLCVGYFILVNNQLEVDLLGELPTQQKITACLDSLSIPLLACNRFILNIYIFKYYLAKI